jgi:S1-C subfamily serine protease
LELPQKPKSSRTSVLVIIVIGSLLAGGLLGYFVGYSATSEEIDNLQDQVTELQEQISTIPTTSEEIGDLLTQLSALQNQLSQVQSAQNQNSQNVTVISEENVSVSQLYEQVKDSVVVIRGMMITQYDRFGRPYYTQVQGSGFSYNFTGQVVIVTNYHVVSETVNITVTFANGNAYTATVLGSDPYAELAVLSADAPQEEYKPLEIVSSSNLKVGDPVMVVGTPYGLAGSMSTGFVSSLGRTLTAETTGGYVIANVIQTTAPLNPGNSGGPVLNYHGQVVGIATAIVEDSQGVGFAIPSNTILREIEDLVNTGSYEDHPWLGAAGSDMTYEIAAEMGTDVTYGWLIAQVTSGGPADKAGLQGGTQQVEIVESLVTIGGDIVIAVNGTRITSIEDLSAYLEEYTLPGQTVNLTVVRDNETTILPLELGRRPATDIS